MRAHTVVHGIPLTTTLSGLRSAIQGLKAMHRYRELEVCSLQEYNRHTGFVLRSLS